MARQRPEVATTTFSLGFPERSYSELDWARESAALCGIKYFQEVLTGDILSDLERIVYISDEPFADTSVIPLYHFAAFSRQKVTVCLSGDGADEICADYETYVADKQHHLSRFIPRPLTRSIGKCLETLLQPSFDKVSTDYKVKHFLCGYGLTQTAAHYSWRLNFDDAGKRRLLRDTPERGSNECDPSARFETIADEVSGCHYLDQAMYVDIKTWLADDILTKVDRATMAHSLEARVPFLDHRVVEFAASLPVGWKLKGLRKKHTLKLSQRDHLPDNVLNRKKTRIQ